jgi:hypothetical protein
MLQRCYDGTINHVLYAGHARDPRELSHARDARVLQGYYKSVTSMLQEIEACYKQVTTLLQHCCCHLYDLSETLHIDAPAISPDR